MPPTLRMTPESWKTLQQQSEAAYPFEGCGLLLGPLAVDKVATKIVLLKNILRDEGRGRFDFSRGFEAKAIDFKNVESRQSRRQGDRANQDGEHAYLPAKWQPAKNVHVVNFLISRSFVGR